MGGCIMIVDSVPFKTGRTTVHLLLLAMARAGERKDRVDGGWPQAKRAGKGNGSENMDGGGGGGGGCSETALISGYSSDQGLEGCGLGVEIGAGVPSVSGDVLVSAQAEPTQASASCDMRTSSQRWQYTPNTVKQIYSCSTCRSSPISLASAYVHVHVCPISPHESSLLKI